MSATPATNVKPNRAATPHALLRSAETTNRPPIITPNMISGAMIGLATNTLARFICMPTSAPPIVGSIVSANSQ